MGTSWEQDGSKMGARLEGKCKEKCEETQRNKDTEIRLIRLIRVRYLFFLQRTTGLHDFFLIGVLKCP